MIIAKERPGVYSDYTANGILQNPAQGNIVGIVAVTAKGEQNKVYSIKKASDAINIFGDSGLMATLCKASLDNGASMIKAVSCGSGDSNDYESAFNVLKTVSGIKVIVCDSEDSLINEKLKVSIMEASENSKERIGVVSCSNSVAKSLAGTLNSERMILVCQPLQDGENIINSCVLAASIAGKIASSSDPSATFNSCKINGYADLSLNFTESEIDDYLSSGVTVFEKVAERLEIIRLVTTKTKDLQGNIDRTFHDINTILIADDVIPSVRNTLSNLIGSAKNNSKTLSAISTQTAVQLENKRKQGIIQAYETPLVSLSEEDNSICIVDIQFTIQRGINQIVISAIINV